RMGDYSRAGEMVEESLNRVGSGKLKGDELLNQAKLQLDWHMERYQLEKMMQGQTSCRIAAWEDAWLRLEEKLHQGIIRELLGRGTEAAYREINFMFNLKRKSFNKLSESEYKLMKREVVDIGRRLATRKSRQWRKSRRGLVDLKNTVRNCLKGGGVPLKLCRRRHKTTRPNLVLLCDVSSSVVNYSAFMLLLVYSMEQSFKKIKSFIFVDNVEDVSPYFSRYGLEEAIELLTVRATCSTSGFSDFGRVFKIFEQQYLSLLTPKTNVIVLGDAKNNYRATEGESFSRLAASCRRVWWLNPQPEEFWGQDDSVIAQYAKDCAAVWECSNLEQLKTIARLIYG
ncbi:MAG: VWA domain-containing protein, partial [Clostridia bacterium]|nr:VWA domain-containing protein [Clostridia bacterium]